MVISSPCLTDIKNWLVQKQTALGKDFLNPFTVDSLLKTICFSTHHASHAPCYSNEALAIPEQTATGKEISNPFMSIRRIHHRRYGVAPELHKKPRRLKDQYAVSKRYHTNSFEALNVDDPIIEEVKMSSKVTTTGTQEEGQCSVPLVERINILEKQILESKLVLVDDGKPLKKVVYPNNSYSDENQVCYFVVVVLKISFPDKEGDC
ncbi:hypothetical protein Tco_0557923 [Tanacetum coccineum]